MQNWLWESFSNMPNGTSYNWDSYTNPNDPYAGTALAGMNADQITQAYRNNSLKKVTGNSNTEPGFWSQLLTGLQQNITQNPVGFGTSVLGGAMNIWQALDSRQRFKQALALDREKYEPSRQIALNNEQRNQEQWDMIKRQRASSAL